MARKVNKMIKKEVETIRERAERLNWGHSKTGRAFNRLVDKYGNKIDPTTHKFVEDAKLNMNFRTHNIGRREYEKKFRR